jgi:hypothetical protein
MKPVSLCKALTILPGKSSLKVANFCKIVSKNTNVNGYKCLLCGVIMIF